MELRASPWILQVGPGWEIFGSQGFLALYQFLFVFSCELLSPLLLGVLPWQWLVWVCPHLLSTAAVSMPTQLDHCREGRQVSPAAPTSQPDPSTPRSLLAGSLLTQLESGHFSQAWLKYSLFHPKQLHQ